MHFDDGADGLSILSEFSKEQSSALHKQNVNLFSLKTDGDEEEIRIKLDGWHCMKRVDHFTYILFFQKQFNNGTCVFSFFYTKNNVAIAAVFENGETEYGDFYWCRWK
jgi:hypothetical protein